MGKGRIYYNAYRNQLYIIYNKFPGIALTKKTSESVSYRLVPKGKKPDKDTLEYIGKL